MAGTLQPKEALLLPLSSDAECSYILASHVSLRILQQQNIVFWCRVNINGRFYSSFDPLQLLPISKAGPV